MKLNVTFVADKNLIQGARKKALLENRSLNEAFVEWLRGYSTGPDAAGQYHSLMRKFGHVRAGAKFSRQEMNERAS
ncbi:hypothetical protein QQ056_06405 [Oscillatoria laete-virens NRMC-F 0139]|nr:hypothetical protein [Oscillatoria laete-virens]MDL5053176.1 hypothetical protein [Oscillatoria laete-virens NRMC-F 0139]